MGIRKTKLTITYREEKLFKQLVRTGLCDASLAYQFCCINLKRLRRLEKEGFVRLSNHSVCGENTIIIQLGKKGKKYCKSNKNQLKIDYLSEFARAQKNHLEHDLKLTAIYYSLEEKVQDSWEHEFEIFKSLKKTNAGREFKTCIDARVKIDDYYMAIEVVGKSYSYKDLTDKVEISKMCNCKEIVFV